MLVNYRVVECAPSDMIYCDHVNQCNNNPFDYDTKLNAK